LRHTASPTAKSTMTITMISSILMPIPPVAELLARPRRGGPVPSTSLLRQQITGNKILE
jgi:hypothetical protein